MSTEFKSNANECERELHKVNCEPPKFKRPTVGCEHFMSVVKRIRYEDNTLTSALFDIIDNVYGLANILKNNNINYPTTKVHIKLQFDKIHSNLLQISISDDIFHGFNNILDGGINSPLNMGHIREGHDNDSESSTFGTGLKKALIYLCNMATIYTRSIRDDGTETHIKVTFDINDMMEKTKPEESYEPTIFDSITADEFKGKHIFSHGSTICLRELNLNSISYNPKTLDKFLTIEELLNYLSEEISVAYSSIIRNEVFTITLNEKKVNYNIDLTEIIPETHKKQYNFYIKLNNTNDCEKIYRKGNSGEYREYTDKNDEDDEKKHQEDNKHRHKFKDIDSDKFNSFISEPNVFCLTMTALTTFGTPHSDLQHNDYTYVSRNGRQFNPPVKITKIQLDGYSNHIYNKVEYSSKRLNKVIGVGPNKQIIKPTNLLISAIQYTQQGRWGTSTYFRNKYTRKNNLNMQPEIQPDVQPEIIPNVQPEIIPVQINTYKKGKSNSKSQSKPQLEEIELEEIPIEEIKIEEIQSEEIQPEETQIEEIQIEEIQTEEIQIEEIELEEIQIEEIQTEEIQIEEIQTEEPQIEEIQPEEIQTETQIVSDNIINVIQENEAIVIINNQQNNINLATNKTHDNLVVESKEKLRSASQIIMELIADPDFDRNDGHKVLEFINMYVSNK